MTKGQYPTISQGLGNLTPDLFRRLMTMLRSYEEKITDERRKAQQPTQEIFLAKITDSNLIGSEYNYYYYDFEEVYFNSAFNIAVKTDGRTGENALNLCEIANTEHNVAPAVDLNGADYPVGFTPRAIGDCIDSVQLEVVVVMYSFVNYGADTKNYVFSLANSHDGTCTA